jgi:glycosyltransferase involved in cell wall biosynthesis
MPCYNAASYLSDAIKSILSQSFLEFELLIIDDGSTDDSIAIIRSFTDERICVIQKSRKGIAVALNLGLKQARAPIIARFDADDICFTDRLQKQYLFLALNPEYIVVGSGADYVDKDGHYIFSHTPVAVSNEEIQVLPPSKCPFIHASVMFRKETVAEMGYDISAHSFEDHLLWLQLKEKGKMYNMPERLLSVRINPGSFTIDEKKRTGKFRKIKAKALNDRRISAEDGQKLLEIISNQNTGSGKQGAYHSLLAKKFLWNNYDPPLARFNMKMAIRLNPFDIRDYLLYIFSYLPKNVIRGIYLKAVSAK